jgi:hypothetical protein
MKPKSDKEIQAVLRLDGPDRFRHFIKQVVDFEEAWGLWSDGWALMANSDGAPVFPLWPAREYAELSRIDDWAEYEPRRISLADLLNDLLPGFQERGVLPGVFPIPTGKGVTPTANELASALRASDLESYG